MSDLAITGGRDAHGDAVDIHILSGRVSTSGPPTPGFAPTESDVLDATGLTVLPGLLDLQVNGAGGHDITAEPDRLWDVAAVLPAYGVTAFIPTVITSAPEARERALEVLAQGPPSDWRGALPLGLHFEGPFLAPERKGAHPERWLRDPALGTIDGWSRDEGLLMATIAPELPGALELIAALTARGVIVSVGHTTATADQVHAAVAAGARLVTHLGNAMPPILAREPGPVGVALGGTDLVAGVIADGYHSAPDFLRLAWTALGPERFLAVTDTTAALGVPDGPNRLGDQDVIVEAGTVRLQDGTLAGSAASLPQCLRVLREATGATLAQAVATATTTAAGLVGDAARGALTPGRRGDAVLVDDDLTVHATVIGGVVVHRKAD
ncbi:N-acetylglucosamine 6-phosphate deacetylase [Nocardioides terrae]|uniref:N-acetylglucosamine 6-phosphate deacetylase n=1 Tax=Nocardioides terrae TaxID=574651 RepID=A0A1I1EV29_9ACTN|nr:N-acetylglucosamine-6-phosphate deacetylase [Nocardioides terrae]SFB91029.1 N-acetylglucosamine 6-phosphate deacetylase [Nocardioides terrae]